MRDSAYGRAHDPSKGESPWAFYAIFIDQYGNIEDTRYLYMAAYAIQNHTLKIGDVILGEYKITGYGWLDNKFAIYYKRFQSAGPR